MSFLVFGGDTMVASTVDSACLKHPSKSISGSRRSSSRIIINGLIRLVEGQKGFANEFGLPLNRVFRHSAERLRYDEPSKVISSWLKDNDQGPAQITALLNDIIEHQLAMCAALDGVAIETLSQLSPLTIRAYSPKLFRIPLFVRRTFKRRLCEFVANDYLRHQQLVVTGFSKAYDQHRHAEKRR